MKQEIYKNMYQQICMTEEQKTVYGGAYRRSKQVLPIQCGSGQNFRRAPQSVRACFWCPA